MLIQIKRRAWSQEADTGSGKDRAQTNILLRGDDSKKNLSLQRKAIGDVLI
jgi:hypothetical protein